MRTTPGLRRVAAAVRCMLAPTAGAAAPDDLPLAPPPAAPASSAGPGFALETEMVVHDWILCISASGAEELARARAEEGIASARAAYASLSETRACGQFPELRVILRERLYEGAGPGHDARAFGALINLSGDWAAAFVVSGGLASD
jgi:hypothetical protein